MPDGDDEVEIPIELWRTPEVFVYKVPPLKAGGHKAADWGLANPHMTGSLRLVSQGETVSIQIFSQEQKLFVACPILLDKDSSLPQSQLEYWVEVVKDSSRYFAVRALNPNTKQVALLGMGFRDRDPAFAFQAALRDHVNRVNRLRGVAKPSGDSDDEGSGDAPLPDSADVSRLTLKAPIKISIPGVEKKPTSAAASGTSKGGAGGLLAPPPAAGKPPPVVDDDDFGDFVS